ncbi:membrane protein [Algoriphagus jejuensis]|uniref:Membrane protein n=1 Tax=Algoriphagus jejuensis TaxID=419934 RepID=A0ABP3YBG4_9BACT
MLSKNWLKSMGVLCTLLIVTEVKAQTSSSTYSALGIGEFNYSGLTQNQGMGGMGISYGTGWQANNVNPAITTRNTIFNFQAALNYKRINVDNGTETSKVDGGGLSYVAMSFPIKSGKFTSGMGLGQITSVNYRLRVDSEVANSDFHANNYLRGDGGISEAYINFGYLLAKNLSIGAHGSYLFGSTIRTNQLLITDEEGFSVGNASEYYERLTVSDVGFKLGAHYMVKVSEKGNLHLGAIYQKLGEVNGTGFAKLAGIDQASNPDSDGDLIANDEPGNIYIPDRIGFGLTYEKMNKFALALEGQFQDFTKYQNFFGDELDLHEAKKVALGFQIVPNYLSFDNLLMRGTYRIGLEWMQTPYYLNQTSINDIGLTLGASIPVNQLSLINFAFKAGQRGTLDNGLIKENYINFTLGFSLNDNSWFYKRVFE